MTLEEANRLVHEYGEFFVKKEGINYVAVVKDSDPEDDNFAIEIGIDSDKLPEPEFSTKISHIKDVPPVPLELEAKSIKTPQEMLDRVLDQDHVKDIIITKSDKFYFQNTIPTKSGNAVRIRNSAIDQGTIGAIIQLEGSDDYYILSNWHVLMQSTGELNHYIINSQNKNIARLYWGLYNEYYDIALAKIIDKNNVIVEKEIYPLKKIKDISIGLKVEKQEITSSPSEGEIRSKNATVKVSSNSGGENYKIFKNQILASKVSSPGDSGSLLIDSKDKRIVGLIFAGDDINLTVCNHLHLLLSNNVELSQFKYTEFDKNIRMPAIKFKSFFINN